MSKSKLIDNIKQSIAILEEDSLKSPGIARLNCQNLHSLYFLLEKYEGVSDEIPTPFEPDNNAKVKKRSKK